MAKGMPNLLRLPALLLASALSVTALTVIASPAAAVVAEGEGDCGAYDDPIFQQVRPGNGASLLTPWEPEATGAARYGFTEDRGTQFKAAIGSQPNLTQVRRLWRAGDFLFAATPADVAAAEAQGYVNQGGSFSASLSPQDCLVAVHRYLKNGKHQTAVGDDQREDLAQAGWTHEGVSFYAAPVAGDVAAPPAPPPPPAQPDSTDTTFTIAVMPDTQQEVLRAGDSRFLNRTEWLADNEDELDLRFVTSSGDVVNWDTPDHSQYEVASRAMRPIEEADIPYSLAIGNHDTAAVGPGGGAADPSRTRVLFRDTSTFNDYFDADRFGSVRGAFEPGKVDNSYSTFRAGGVDWMVMTLELWPRPSAVVWADGVIEDHPDHNVLIVTHEYLDGGGGLGQSGQYGDTSPQRLFDELVSQHANVRMVFSGHVGIVGNRTDTGVQGNRIYSFLQTIHDNRTNPVRLVEIDTREGTIKTWFYSPYTNQSYPDWSVDISGVDWVR